MIDKHPYLFGIFPYDSYDVLLSSYDLITGNDNRHLSDIFTTCP